MTGGADAKAVPAVARNDVARPRRRPTDPVASSEELKAFVVSEIKKWAKIVADAKIEPE